MFINEYVLSVDLKKRLSKTIPIFVQYDSAAIVFKVFNNGREFDLTGLTKAIITHKLPDGSTFSEEGHLISLDGQQAIRYTYSGGEMRIIGDVSITLALFADTSKVTIPPLKLKITKNY